MVLLATGVRPRAAPPLDPGGPLRRALCCRRRRLPPALDHARPRNPDHLATEGGGAGPMTAGVLGVRARGLPPGPGMTVRSRAFAPSIKRRCRRSWQAI